MNQIAENLVDFFETNGITTVYGSNLRAVLSSLPDSFLRNISEEDRTKNMQELTKIRDSMTPEALSALHSAHYSKWIYNAYTAYQKGLDFEEAQCIVARNALNPQLTAVGTTIYSLLQAIGPSQYLEMRIYVISSCGFTNLHKFYDCLIENIKNQQWKEINEPLEDIRKKDEKKKRREEIRKKREEERKEGVRRRKEDDFDEFVFPVFQNDELVRSDEDNK